jgi:hypothetical protein
MVFFTFSMKKLESILKQATFFPTNTPIGTFVLFNFKIVAPMRELR